MGRLSHQPRMHPVRTDLFGDSCLRGVRIRTWWMVYWIELDDDDDVTAVVVHRVLAYPAFLD
jgi:hypothetical protein